MTFLVPFLNALVAAVFLLASVSKLFSSYRSRREMVNGYRLLPDKFVDPVTKSVPWIELFLAIGLLSGRGVWAFSAGAILVLVSFAFGISVNLFRGNRDIDCGCFGVRRATLSWWLVSRNLVLIGVLTFRLAELHISTKPDQALSLLADGSVVALGIGGLLVRVLISLLQNNRDVLREPDLVRTH